MEQGGMMLPLGILLLGVAAVAGFMAFRPWPMPGGNPIKPGSYAVEILQGKPPAASTPPDRQADITVIEGGLATFAGLWAINKLAGGVSGLLPAGGGASQADQVSSIEGELSTFEGEVAAGGGG